MSFFDVPEINVTTGGGYQYRPTTPRTSTLTPPAPVPAGGKQQPVPGKPQNVGMGTQAATAPPAYTQNQASQSGPDYVAGKGPDGPVTPQNPTPDPMDQYWRWQIATAPLHGPARQGGKQQPDYNNYRG